MSSPATALEPKAPKTLIAKLAEIVHEIDSVEKRGRNDFHKYSYVKAADVAWVVRKALCDRNIYLVADVVEIRNYEIPAKEDVMQAVDIKMQFSFFDGDAPETLPVVLHSFGTGTDKGDKAVYKAQTGALKYGLRHAFLIPDESDPEGDTNTDKATSKEAKAIAKVLGEAKAKSMAQNGSQRVTTLFYAMPERHNGNFAEFVNVASYLSSNQDKEQSVTSALREADAKKTKDDTALVATHKMSQLLAKLAGDCGVDIHELKAKG